MAQPPLTGDPLTGDPLTGDPLSGATATAGQRGPAALSPHDPAWAERAAALLGAVRVAFRALDPDDACAYDHIGSTSVPGLAAKPYLDLQVRVPVLLDVGVYEAALRDAGFRRETGSRPDSPGVTADSPRGRADVDPAVWRKWLFTSRDDGAILHVRRADSPWAAWTIEFRDWLREDVAHRDRYESIKRRLADAHADDADFDDYTRAKTAFFDEIQPIIDTRRKGATMTTNADEQAIRELIERWAAAVHAGDLDTVVADHTADVVMFDVPPPHDGVRGIDAYRAIWPPFFEFQASGGTFEIIELDVTAGAGVAYAWALLRCGQPDTNAAHPDWRLRVTIGLRKEWAEDGARWVITHEHHSFPSEVYEPSGEPNDGPNDGS